MYEQDKLRKKFAHKRATHVYNRCLDGVSGIHTAIKMGMKPNQGSKHKSK